MTRLRDADMAALAADPDRWGARLTALTGLNLLTLAASALDVTPAVALRAASVPRVAVVPVTSGEGIISGFAEALAAIARCLGFSAVVLPPDDPGFALAKKNCDISLWADDSTFVARNHATGVRADNNRATGWGFAAVLAHMGGSLTGKNVLVLGCGPVGATAAEKLLRYDADVHLCDLDPSRAEAVAHSLSVAGISSGSVRVVRENQLATALPDLGFLLDAAPTSRIFPLPLLAGSACIAAPCVPCPWPETLKLYHDPLQTGTSVMLLAAALNMSL